MAEATKREKRMMADGSRTSDWASAENWAGLQLLASGLFMRQRASEMSLT
jgi:hypothetical protein